jgi:hypothetical protein
MSIAAGSAPLGNTPPASVGTGRHVRTAGDALPPGGVLIEVRVAELQQLFNGMDASPFRERDLDPNAEEFIVGWAREAPRGTRLGLLVELSRGPGLDDEPAVLRDAIRGFFAHRAQMSRARLRQLLRVGRTSLLVGLCFLVAAVGLGGVVAISMKGQRIGEFIQQGLSICGWVAMWRPLEIFLYGWWPIRTETQLYDLLSVMPVRIAYTEAADPEAWRHDWPAWPRPIATPQKAPPHAGALLSTVAVVAADRGPVAVGLTPPAAPVARSGPP